MQEQVDKLNRTLLHLQEMLSCLMRTRDTVARIIGPKETDRRLTDAISGITTWNDQIMKGLALWQSLLALECRRKNLLGNTDYEVDDQDEHWINTRWTQQAVRDMEGHLNTKASQGLVLVGILAALDDGKEMVATSNDGKNVYAQLCIAKVAMRKWGTRRANETRLLRYVLKLRQEIQRVAN